MNSNIILFLQDIQYCDVMYVFQLHIHVLFLIYVISEI